MKKKMQRILDAFHRYNSENMAFQAFGLSADEYYDALVVAPSYTPFKLIDDPNCKITLLREGAYIAGYLVEKDGLRIAWIKIGSSAGNLIDHLALCAELRFKKLIFIGAVGALTADFALGDICTPSYSIAGNYANTYLKESIRDFVPFERVEPPMEYVDSVVELMRVSGYNLRKASVFCTASIAMEYYHLDEIRSFGTDLIEMETSSFYLMAELMEVPAIALMVVSDNSATGTALVGRTEDEQRTYNRARKVILPDMIFKIAGEDGN